MARFDWKFELLISRKSPLQIFSNFMSDLLVLLLDKFLKDAALVLRFRAVNLAYHFPNFTSKALTADLIETLMETLANPCM